MSQDQIKAAREALSSLDDYARMNTGVDAIGPRKVLEDFIAEAERTTQPAQDSLHRSLDNLAMALWRTHYRESAPEFELLPDATGVLSQIDNMASGLVRPAPAQDQLAAVRAVPDTDPVVDRWALEKAVCAGELDRDHCVYKRRDVVEIIKVLNKRATDAEAKLAAIRAQEPVEFPMDERNDDPAEAAFWRFDARHKGYGRWKQAPQSERDAFKAEYRAALAHHTTPPSQGDTNGLPG